MEVAKYSEFVPLKLAPLARRLLTDDDALSGGRQLLRGGHALVSRRGCSVNSSRQSLNGAARRIGLAEGHGAAAVDHVMNVRLSNDARRR